MMFDEPSEILLWLSVAIALLYTGGSKLVRKVRENQFEGYEDEE